MVDPATGGVELVKRTSFAHSSARGSLTFKIGANLLRLAFTAGNKTHKLQRSRVTPMVDSTLLLVFQIAAAAGVLILICSPSLLMHQIYKQKDVGVASIVPLATLWVDTHLWMLYGLMAEYWFPIFSCFVFGDVAAVSYVTIYWYYSKERRHVARILAIALVFITIITIYAIVGGLGYTGQSRHGVSSILGYVGDATAVCVFASPMEKLLQVLKYQSAVFINVHMVIGGITNNSMWLVYGALINNWIIIAPNIFFAALNIFTLVLYLVYNPKTHPLRDSYFRDADQTPKGTSNASDSGDL